MSGKCRWHPLDRQSKQHLGKSGWFLFGFSFCDFFSPERDGFIWPEEV